MICFLKYTTSLLTYQTSVTENVNKAGGMLLDSNILYM